MEYRRVLIYDGDCPFCSAAATALRRLNGTGMIGWSADPAQAFMAAQFREEDAIPFALVFADSEAERVWVGREAARELCERAGLPALIGDITRDNYEGLADAVRTVTGAEGNPDAYHDEQPMRDSAREAFGALADAAAETGGSDHDDDHEASQS